MFLDLKKAYTHKQDTGEVFICGFLGLPVYVSIIPLYEVCIAQYGRGERHIKCVWSFVWVHTTSCPVLLLTEEVFE